MFTHNEAMLATGKSSMGFSPKSDKMGKRERIKAAMTMLWTTGFRRSAGQSSVADENTKMHKRNHWRSGESCVQDAEHLAGFSAREECLSTGLTQSSNDSALTLKSLGDSSVLSEYSEINTRSSDTSASCTSVFSIADRNSLLTTSNEVTKMGNQTRLSQSATDETNDRYPLTWGKRVLEDTKEETWIAKLLKDYCPVRFRRIKHLNYESPQFRSKQMTLTLQAIADQEQREGDRKVRHRPDRGSPKFLRGWLHFEVDDDVLDSVDDFIASNRGLPSLFSGTGPAVRRHFFRRWKNVDRDQAIIYDQLRNLWLKDKHAVCKLKAERQRRNEKLENKRFLEELFNGPPDRFPPLAFFANRAIRGVKRLGSQSNEEQRIKGVPSERSIRRHPYFAAKHRQAKAWIKDLLLSI